MEDNKEEIKDLERMCETILLEQLKKYNMDYTLAKVRVYENIRTVGVQGDARTYLYPAEIELRGDGKIVWDEKFIAETSTRITNEIKAINRVLYVFAKKI